MQSTRSRYESGHVQEEPALILLWRQPVDALVQLARRADKSRVVLVRLVNQPLDEAVRAACRNDGLSVVTLPLAFAGLHAGDRVLRDAVLQRLEAQRRVTETNTAAMAGVPA